MVVRRSGAPWWSFATRTSVRWPTTSRPRRTQPRRRSSSRSPAPSSRTALSDAGTPAGSRTRRSAPARRANATRRPSRSAGRGGRGPPRRPAGAVCVTGDAVLVTGPSRAPARSRTRRSAARAWRSDPAIASASSTESGTRIASHSRRTPRAAASTGSRLRARSTQATRAPPAWASATVRRARVVAPLDPLPRRTTVPARGRPPAASSASSSGKPVGMRRPTPLVGSPESGRVVGANAGWAPPGRGTSAGRVGFGKPPGVARAPSGSVVAAPGGAATTSVSAVAAPTSAGNGAAASAPKTSTAGRGAADPQRARRLARAAARSAW